MLSALVHAAVRKGTTSPEWNETIHIPLPPESRPPSRQPQHSLKRVKISTDKLNYIYRSCAVVIEVYSMGVFGKGSFLGQITINLDALCSPPANEINVALSAKVSPDKTHSPSVKFAFLLFALIRSECPLKSRN